MTGSCTKERTASLIRLPRLKLFGSSIASYRSALHSGHLRSWAQATTFVSRSLKPCARITAFGARLYMALGFGLPTRHSCRTTSHFVRSYGRHSARSSICSETLVSGQLGGLPVTLIPCSSIRRNDWRSRRQWPFCHSAAHEWRLHLGKPPYPTGRNRRTCREQCRTKGCS